MRWHQSNVAVVIDPSIDDIGPDAADAIVSAMGAWVETSARLPRLTADRSTVRGTAARDGVNRILRGPIAFAGHENDIAITITHAEPESGAILEVDIIINEAHDFATLSEAGDNATHGTACGQRYDLQSVAAHELGHFLGVGEDHDDRETTMYFKTARCETQKRSLTEPDEAAVAAAYATPAEEAAPGVGCSLQSGRTKKSGWMVLAVAGLLAFGLRRLR